MSTSLTSSSAHEPLENWSHRVADIPERGLEIVREATPVERAELAKELQLIELSSLNTTYRVRAIGGGRFSVKGELSAVATQSCIVTLEPVPAKINESFDEEFWPEDQVPEPLADGEEEERDALATIVPEAIQRGLIDIGRLVYEQLATAIDPYPRAPSAEFSWADDAKDGSEGKPGNPFAALAALKDKT